MHSNEIIEKIQEFAFDILMITNCMPNEELALIFKSKIVNVTKALTGNAKEMIQLNSKESIVQKLNSCESHILKISFYLMFLIRVNLVDKDEAFKILSIADAFLLDIRKEELAVEAK